MPNKLTILDRIIPEYRKILKEQSSKNFEALRNSEGEGWFNNHKNRLLNAYNRINKTNPVTNMWEEDFARFLKDKEFKNMFQSGNSGGANEFTDRQGYSKKVYGYPEEFLKKEKYGTIPIEEFSENRQKLPKSYGQMRVHFKPEIKERTTINVGDSSNQWPSVSSYYVSKNLRPIPYGLEDPEEYIGGWMDGDYFFTRDRNGKIARLLEGENPDDYIEAHFHGDITPEDVDFVEFDPELFKNRGYWTDYEPWMRTDEGIEEHILEPASRYGIRFVNPKDYKPVRR